MIRFMQTSAAFKKYALTGILAVICIAMAWYLVPTFTGQGLGVTNKLPVVATVSGQDITSDEVMKEARQIIQRQYPNMAGQASRLAPMLVPQAAQDLIARKVLLGEADHMGLRATDDDIREYLEHGPYAQTFFPGGKYIGQQQYEELLQNANLTVAQFEQEVADEIRINKLQSMVTAGASVSDSEIKDQFEKQNTKVKFNYAVIKKDDILKSLHPADAELKAYYDRNMQLYINSIPEKRQLKYIVIDVTKLMAGLQVSQDDLQSYYNDHRDEFRAPEQINVRQILIKKPLPGTDGKVDPKAVEAAHAKADDISKQLKSGANFADLAKKDSEDTDTAKNGGSLGWVRPDAFPVDAVSKAVASMAKGSTSDVIDGGYAFVILHVDDKQEAHVKSLDEVKAQIEPIIKQQNAARQAQNLADQVTSDAKSTSLEKAAAAKGLQMVSTDFVTSHDALPGIGNDQEFMSAVFGQTVNAPPDEVGLHTGYAIYQVTAVKPPSTPTFDEIRSQVENQFKNERASQDLTQKTQELSDRAKSEHDLKKAAKELGAEYKTSDFVLPDGQVPDVGSMEGDAKVAFTLKPGDTSGPISNGSNGAVLSVVDRQAPTDADFAAKKDQIRETLIQQKQQELFGLFLSDLRDSMQKSGKIKMNQKELEALQKPRTESE